MIDLQPFEIDPAWPVVRDESGDQFDDSECENCEICFARTATHIADLHGVEGWACDYCR